MSKIKHKNKKRRPVHRAPTVKLIPGYEDRREEVAGKAENPYQRGEAQEVTRNVRESNLGLMLARKQIDAPQHRAGMWFLARFERARASAMASDPAREFVDSSRRNDPIAQRIIEAVMDLAEVAPILGKPGLIIVELVCGEGLNVAEAADRILGRPSSQFEKKVTGWLLRGSLDALAEHLGFGKMKGGRATDLFERLRSFAPIKPRERAPLKSDEMP